MGTVEKLLEDATQLHVEVCLKHAVIAEIETTYKRNGEVDKDTFTYLYKAKVLNALKDFPDKIKEAHQLCKDMEEERLQQHIKAREIRARKREEARLARIEKYKSYFPEHLTPFTGGTVIDGNLKWQYAPNGQSVEDFPTITGGTGIKFSWFGNESTGNVCMISQEEYGWGILSDTEFEWHGPHGRQWMYTSKDNITWNNCFERSDAPRQWVVSADGAKPVGGTYPANLISGVNVSGSVPPCVVIGLAMFKYSLSILERQQAQFEYDRAYNAAKDRIMQRTLDTLQKASIKSCNGCNSSGANIYVCPDCLHSYCTNCTGNGGVNVCRRCGSYHAIGVPSSLWQLPHSCTPSDRDIVNEMR